VAISTGDFMSFSLFSVGEDGIHRNNQEIRKRKGVCGLSTTEGIAVAHP
jgi:hypothetical protein